MKPFEKFNAAEVPLEGSNLIEASAGTGKTYSIAILVLRLLLEKGLSIKEILMVTFTKAAVAELEERIRLFVRKAYRASKGEEIDDRTISLLVERSIVSRGREDVSGRLKDAVLFLDETSVLTIHSFCQQTLNEFAFETKQLFGADLVTDTDAILEEEINGFWRKYITSVPVGLLKQLLKAGMSRQLIGNLVREHLGGKRYVEYVAGEDYSLCEGEHMKFQEDLLQLQENEAELRDCLMQHITESADELKAISEANRYAKNGALQLIDNPADFLKFISSKRESKYVANLYQPLLTRLDDCDKVIEDRNEILRQLIRKICCHAINVVSGGIALFKAVNNQLYFDDLIVNLHKAFAENEVRLAESLQGKYKAVFIDEFQDTDRLQYEIFDKAFGTGTIFYIGDPKQSIYAWRKADIFTYFKAKDNAGRLYSMNQNFRSSEALIKAMNVFFKPHEQFDTFYFQDEQHAIDYLSVESPEPNSKGNLLWEEEVAVPLTITELPNKGEICTAVASQVLELLAGDEYLIASKDTKRKITPSDIGILVRNNKQGQAIKAKLAALGIPAVTIGDAKVLQSEEARYLLYLLEAMVEISRASINKALLSPFTGLSDSDILRLDDEAATENFRKYKGIWEKDGVYASLNSFIGDYNVKGVLLKTERPAERTFTNLYQLIELLHKVQTLKKLSPAELISWLKRGMEGMETVGDEYEQRIESDEEAVKIVTIHKSKGLEYKIVLAPFLDLKVESKHEHCSFRDSHTGEYVSGEKKQLNPEQIAEYERQMEQEHRRLIYVAITRGVYKCFVYRSTGGGGSSLAYFVNALKTAASSLVEFRTSAPDTVGLRYIRKNADEKTVSRTTVEFTLLEQNWRKMSYTMLNAAHQSSLKNYAGYYSNEYDNFVFAQLRKGAKTGNMLHYIFENVHFADSNQWPFVVERAIDRFMPGNHEATAPRLLELLEHVLNVPLAAETPAFTLGDVSGARCIHEFEFDFKVSNFNPGSLRGLSGDGIEINIKDHSALEGIMNGKIDLFFEHNGRYYVLDWKSNFLGDSLDNYTAQSVASAMNENNYHLQHLIYTLAVKKYLESRLPDFDYSRQFGGVIYLFVRGVRKGAASGIFQYKAPFEKIIFLDRLLATDRVMMPD